ncbi:hypothetical protein [Enterococcus sp. DIV0086]|uniref:hypothetical protein n=1 Tax=Enterococcus sp. DIV0086 TaxID=2774655 RepID=UPI003D299758
MRKMIFGTVLLGGLMGSALFIQVPVHAAESNKTEANITVNGGGLNIDALGKIDFEAITLNGQEQTSQPTDPKTPALNIHDYRGKATGWYLQANYEKNKALGEGLTLHVAPTTEQKGTATPIDIGEDAMTFYKLDAADPSNPDTTLTLSPTIKVPAKTPAKSYTGTIVWNAVEGAPA